MSKQLTDVDTTFTAQVTVPTPGETVTAESVEVGFQALANRTAHLKSGDTTFTGLKLFQGASTFEAGLSLSAGGSSIVDHPVEVASNGEISWSGATALPKIGSRVYTYAQDISAGKLASTGTGVWTFTGNRLWVLTTVGAGAQGLHLSLTHAPHLATIHTVTAHIDGNAGGSNHAALPATKPLLAVQKRVHSTGALSVLGSVSDAPADVAAYEAYHAIALDLSAGGHVIDGSASYYITLDGEAGANSQDGALALLALTVSFTCTQVGPG